MERNAVTSILSLAPGIPGERVRVRGKIPWARNALKANQRNRGSNVV